MTLFYLDSGGAANNSGTTDSTTPTASGSSNATILANITFTSGNVDTVNNLVTITGHGYSTGMGIFLSTSGALPSGFANTILYFLRALSVDTLAFYLSLADANADTNRIDITTNGTGTQTLNNRTVQLGGSPTLSGIAATHCRTTTSGTSHIITFDAAHGISTGDIFYVGTGTTPGGLASNVYFFANALSSTTLRAYSTNAGAQAGGASTINCALANAHYSLACKDVLQRQTIFLDSATNSNRKNFNILLADNTNKWVIVDATVTGLGAGSNWAIGGSVNASGAVDLFNILSASHTFIFNTDISGALNVTLRNAIFNGGLPMVLRGKAGARRVFTNTGNGTLLGSPNQSGNQYFFENLEFQSQGTGGIMVAGSISTQCMLANCRITDSGGSGVQGLSGTQFFVVDSEITGCSNEGINGPASATTPIRVFGSYIHDNGGTGITGGGLDLTVVDTIIERNTGNNIQGNTSVNAFSVVQISGCTIYHSSANGYSIGDTVSGANPQVIRNTIFKDNGNVSTEANIKWGFAQHMVASYNNVYNVSGGLGGTNLLAGGLGSSGFSTDITSDPLFVDPDNGTVASRNFGLSAGSPAKDIAYAFPGGGSTSHRDRGAVQSTGSGGGLLQGNLRGNFQ